MTTLLWTLLVAASVVALIWAALAIRVVSLILAFRPLLPSDAPEPDDAPAVDAIVPARNEERDVAATVESLLAQDYPHLTVTVIDDQSTDATGAILDGLAARPPGRVALRVIHGVDRPEGWVGKTWALQQGVERAGAEWLWFVDGDMRLHPKALATAVDEARRSGADLVTFAPGADCATFWQGAVALMLTQLLAHLYPSRHVNDPDRPEALAIGGFILVRRSVYEEAGGHAAVRGEIVEDIALARRIKSNGGRLALRAAPQLARTHMYGSLAEIWRGLRKNAFAGMDYQLHKYVTGVIVSLAMAWLPPMALAVGSALWLSGVRGPVAVPALAIVGLLGWLAQAMAALPFAFVLRLAPPYAFSLPLGITLYVAIATSSVWNHYRGRILWKGRVYAPTAPLRPRRGG